MAPSKPKSQNSMAKTNKTDLKSYLAEIKKISDWFDDQDEIDLEEALEKIQAASELIKLSKQRIDEVENKFTEIKAEIEAE